MRPQTELGLGTAGVSSSRLAKEGQTSLDNFPMRKLVALSSAQLEYQSKTKYYKKKHDFRFSLSFVLIHFVR